MSQLIPTYNTVGVYIPRDATNVRYTVDGGAAQIVPDAWLWDNGTELVGALLLQAEDSDIVVLWDGPSAGSLSTTTWSSCYTEASTRTVTAAEPLIITEGGSAAGYVVYDGGGVSVPYVEIRASYVILRDLIVNDANDRHGIGLYNAISNVVIEDCEVTNWGDETPNSDTAYGGIGSDGSLVSKITIQRNRIHTPRGTSLSWDTGQHPGGPLGIQIKDSAGNNVIRYNEITGATGHYLRDGMRGGTNASDNGFPGRDSDIYGNIVMRCWDDAIEAEGGGLNVRIWGNYMDLFFQGIACTPVSLGPLFVFKNITRRSQRNNGPTTDSWARGAFAKCGDGTGRAKFYHNFTVSEAPAAGQSLRIGVKGGVMGDGGNVFNHECRNNVFLAQTATAKVYSKATDASNDYDYDTYCGQLGDVYSGAEPNGEDLPTYTGVTIVNTFDGHSGQAYISSGISAAVEDVGLGSARGIGTEVLEFGTNAYLDQTGCQSEPEPGPGDDIEKFYSVTISGTLMIGVTEKKETITADVAPHLQKAVTGPGSEFSTSTGPNVKFTASSTKEG